MSVHQCLFRLVIALALMPPAHAAPPDLCTDPLRAVCEEKYPPPPANEDSIRERAKELVIGKVGKARFDKMIKADDPLDPAVLPDYLVYQNSIYDAVFAELQAKGISERELLKHMLEIRNTISKRVKDGLGPADGPTAKQGYSNTELSEAVDDIQIFTARQLSAVPSKGETSDWRTAGYFGTCGSDGLSRNAFYSFGKFTICPGMLLNVLDTGSIYALDFVTAHEMGHALDAQANPNTGAPEGKNRPLWDRYRGMMACVEKNYAKDLTDLKTAGAQLTDRIIKPAREKIAALSAAPRPDDAAIFNEKRKINAFSEMVEGIEVEHRFMHKTLGRAPLVSETHSAELCADHFGSASLAEHLKKVVPEERAKLLKATFRWLCKGNSESIVDLKYNAIKGDGTHPPLEWRIFETLQNPTLRQTLGCKSLGGEKPWCTFSGNNSLVASCGPPADKVATALECEESLRGLLKGTCDTSYLACTPMEVKRFACEGESADCSMPLAKGNSGTCKASGPKSSSKFLGRNLPYVCKANGSANGYPIPEAPAGSAKSAH